MIVLAACCWLGFSLLLMIGCSMDCHRRGEEVPGMVVAFALFAPPVAVLVIVAHTAWQLLSLVTPQAWLDEEAWNQGRGRE